MHAPSPVLSLLHELNQSGEFWLVGGCVRDTLMGRKPKDWDIVTTTPEVVEGKFPMIGKDFPVYQAKVDGHTVEIAAARTERKVGSGHTGFEVQVTRDLKADLLRRDLTINTFAWSPKTGFVCDPRAHEDLESRTLRHVSDAFGEDPLRVFRVARFASQLNSLVAEETTQEMSRISGTLTELPKDRVREELTKALRSNLPGQFFHELLAAGCMDHWFPEVRDLVGKPHSVLHHPEGDAYDHTMMVLDKARDLGASDDAMLCALTHDFGKALTDPKEWPRHLQHEKLGIEPIRAFCERLGFGHQINHAMNVVCKYHMQMHRAFELRPNTLKELSHAAFRTVLGIPGFNLCCQADHCGRGGHWNDEYPQAEFLLGVHQSVRSVRVDPAWNVNRIEQEQIKAIRMFKESQCQ